MPDGSERFSAKRDAGLSVTRRDGSSYSAQTDRDAFDAEVWATRCFGKEPNVEVFETHGDEGYDFALLVDVYWIGRRPDGSPRREGHLIENPYRKAWPDRFVVVSGIAEVGFQFEGWCTTAELKNEPKQNFGYGNKFAMPLEKLHGR